MKRKTRSQARNTQQFVVNEEYVRLCSELIALIKRGTYPKTERVKKIDVELVVKTIGISALKVLTYENFKKELAQIMNSSKS